jgi:TolB-like protein/class 3 adenylate cyclase
MVVPRPRLVAIAGIGAHMSNPMSVSRRLVAVFAADVEGYSRLMGADEVGTLKGLTERRAILDRFIAEHRGRIANTAGDSVLAEFGSAVDAVQSAVDAQTALAEANSTLEPERRISFRIGIHIGDVMVRAGDLFGDGVNIAARLQSIAKPGGVCISGATYDQVRKVLPITFAELGVQQVKNIQEPIRAYRAGRSSEASETAPARVVETESPLPLPDKPSIAVLPFQNMSGDPEQEYFADGMVEEIITALSRLRELFVIARNSTFTYKGKPIDIRQVGRELGVRYVLEGSVRKMGNRVRITGQLIEAASGTHLWADRFDGDLQDIFNLQDQVTGRVANAIAPTIEQVEINRAAHKPTENLDAYDFYLRGVAAYYRFEKDATDDALRYFIKANQLDPNFALANALAASCYLQRRVQGWMVDAPKEIAEATRLARRAAELGKNDATALCYASATLAYVARDLDAGANLIDRALLLNPNSAVALHFRSHIKGWIGEPEQAIEDGLRAMRLDPLAPGLFYMQSSIAYGHFFAGRYGEASSWAERSIQEHISAAGLRVLSASLALAGKLEEARDAAIRLMHFDPALRVSQIKGMIPIRRPDDLVRLEGGLRLAGLPE